MKPIEYIDDHMRYFISFILMICVQFLLLCFANIPILLAAFISGLWFVFLIIASSIDYIIRMKEQRKISNILAQLDQKYLLHEVLPTALNYEGQFYKDLLRAGNKSMIESISKVKRDRLAYQEYVEQWVHEVKTPIAAMKLWSENQEGERKREISKQIERTEHYVEQALFYARSENVHKDLRVQLVELHACIAEAFLQCKYLCMSAHMKIEFHCEDVYVYSDEKWLIFILNQLIENAVKYRKVEDGRLRIEASVNDNYTTLFVLDYGIGIPSNDLSRIFEKGYTGENGRFANMHATGIGLYLCEKLCHALEIEITVSSKVGEYTKVELRFHA